MHARSKIITLFTALSFLVGWTTIPTTCSAQAYGYQVQPVQVYNYPNYQGYTSPALGGYYVASPAPPPCKYKKHKHKHKHKHRYCQYY